MEKRNITAGHSENEISGERPTVFRNDKLSLDARKIMQPIWAADYKLKFNIIDRLNVLLYDRKDALMFNLNGKLNIMYRFSLYRVIGVRCKPATRICGKEGEARRLLVILQRHDERREIDALSIMSLTDIMKMYEMVVRKLYPRDDNPDGIGMYDDGYYELL